MILLEFLSETIFVILRVYIDISISSSCVLFDYKTGFGLSKSGDSGVRHSREAQLWVSGDFPPEFPLTSSGKVG